MKPTFPRPLVWNSWHRALGVILLLALAVTAPASTVWNGPSVAFYHPYLGTNDLMTTNVLITRGSFGGLYNATNESGAVYGTSPKGTEWAIGTLANYQSLSYGPCPLEAGHHPPGYVGTTFVVHLITNDIYLQLTLTNWGGGGGAPGQQTFGYIRTTASLPPPTPTVTVTNPVTGTIFAAPATVNLGASASVTSGTVTNVQFFTNSVFYKSVLTSPFTTTASLAAGSYALTAVATAAGISATSAVVNITVLTPPTVSITNPAAAAVFAAPATVKLGATASATVTNVQFFANASLVGSVKTAPFVLTSGTLSAGSYALSAVATASGLSTTSAVVNISVVTPTTVSASSAKAASGHFNFSYSVDSGLSYVLQSSSNLVNWVSLSTNTAGSNTMVFSATIQSNGAAYFRVGRMPNP